MDRSRLMLGCAVKVKLPYYFKSLILLDRILRNRANILVDLS
jgi:hypothetical protein